MKKFMDDYMNPHAAAAAADAAADAAAADSPSATAATAAATVPCLLTQTSSASLSAGFACHGGAPHLSSAAAENLRVATLQRDFSLIKVGTPVPPQHLLSEYLSEDPRFCCR